MADRMHPDGGERKRNARMSPGCHHGSFGKNLALAAVQMSLRGVPAVMSQRAVSFVHADL
jgi:hypothetical protein